MAKVKKGSIVAYYLETLTLTEQAETWRPPLISRDASWALGTVWASSRAGRVKELAPAGLDGTVSANRLKMLAKYEAVTDVLHIPADRVDGPAMLQGARHVSWPTLTDCEDYVRLYVVDAMTLGLG